MCGIEMHGFWWEKFEQDVKDYEVVFAWEVNSHQGIRSKFTIPSNANNLGVSPITGEVVSNGDVFIPDRVKEKASLLFQAYRPNKECIVEHLRANYAKNNDKREWDIQLPRMLSGGGMGLFSKKYRTERAQDRTEQAQDCTKRAQDRTKWAQDCTERAQDHTKWAQDCTERAQDCTGTMDEMDIEKFIAYFLEHPNKYWADRKEERRIKYEEFVRA